MWVLKISRNGKELIRSAVYSSSVLVGRSPVCDVVLRAPGVHPVHFMLEWLGEGDVQAGGGEWSLIELTGSGDELSEKKVQELGIGTGFVLADRPIQVAGFEFSWYDDKLSESKLTGGLLHAQVSHMQNTQMDVTQAMKPMTTLEVIGVDGERDVVTDVFHLDSKKLSHVQRPLKELPQLATSWDPNNVTRVQLSIQGPEKVEMFMRGQPVTSTSGQLTYIGPMDLLQVRWKMKDYYFRLVPEVESVKTPLSVTRDPFYMWLMIAVGLFLLLLMFFINREPTLEIKPEPPRIAKVEVYQAPQPEAPLVPEPEPKLEVPKPKEEPKEVAKPTPPEPPRPLPKTAESQLPAKGSPQPKSQTADGGLNRKAPAGPRESMGLLGLVKNSANQPQVKADKLINEGLISDRVSGTAGDFVIKQPPAGIIGDVNKPGAKTDITRAETKVNVGSLGSGTGELGNIGAGKGDGLIIGYGSQKGRGGVDSADFEESIEGGLDKESVRKTISAYRKELRTCYERAMLVKPRIQGRIRYRWVITASGETQACQMIKSEVGVPTFEACVKSVLEGIQWPHAANKKQTIVLYPFQFQAR